MGLVLATRQINSFSASKMMRAFFHREWKKHEAKDVLKSWTSNDQYSGGRNLNTNEDNPCESHNSFLSLVATTLITFSKVAVEISSSSLSHERVEHLNTDGDGPHSGPNRAGLENHFVFDRKPTNV